MYFKRAILILSLFIISKFSFSQTIDTYQNTVGKWNETTKKYDFLPFIDTTITFDIGDEVIKTDDKKGSFYKISNRTQDENNNYNKITFDCIDEKNRKCQLSIVYYKEKEVSYIMVDYYKISYIYTIKT